MFRFIKRTGVIIMMALILILQAAPAAAQPTTADSETFPIPHCQDNCLIVTGIQLSPIYSGDTRRLEAEVNILDEHGKAVEGAIIAFIWKLPNGTQSRGRVMTGQDGSARTFIPASESGTYVFRINRIYKPDFSLDLILSMKRAEILLH